MSKKQGASYLKAGLQKMYSGGRQAGKATMADDVIRYMQMEQATKDLGASAKASLLKKAIEAMGMDSDKYVSNKEVHKAIKKVVEVDPLDDAIERATAIMKQGE